MIPLWIKNFMLLSQVVQDDDILDAWWQEILLYSLEELALCHDTDAALVRLHATQSLSVQ
jgi:hypothetical protein